MHLQLSIERVKEIPLNQYDKNFTFIVNGTQYHTSRIIADILSPSICQLHYNDPTINEYYINTSHAGDFQHILNLISYNIYNIQETEVPFICEVLEKLNNQMIKIHLSEEVTITKDNVIDIITKYENSYIYSSIFTKAIDFISCHFYEINDDEKRLHNLKKDTIEKIIQNDKLQLESEDQLLSFINELVESNPIYMHLYENVDFLNTSPSNIEKFVSIFDYNDLTSEIWKKITIRFIQNISIENDYQQNYSHHKYCNKGLPLLYKNNNEFQGIFDHIQKKGNIYSEIDITSSPLCLNEETDSPKHAVQFGSEKYFRTTNVENAFICFDFKNRKICPKSYTIRSTKSSNNSIRPKSWAIEVSNDNSNWEVIDEQMNSLVLNKSGSLFTFNISKANNNQYRYVRMRQTDHGYDADKNGNPRNDYNLVIDSIEFYGYLYE